MRSYLITIISGTAITEKYISAKEIVVNEIGQILFYQNNGFLFAVAPSNALVTCLEDMDKAKKIV